MLFCNRYRWEIVVLVKNIDLKELDFFIVGICNILFILGFVEIMK